MTIYSFPCAKYYLQMHCNISVLSAHIFIELINIIIYLFNSFSLLCLFILYCNLSFNQSLPLGLFVCSLLSQIYFLVRCFYPQLSTSGEIFAQKSPSNPHHYCVFLCRFWGIFFATLNLPKKLG